MSVLYVDVDAMYSTLSKSHCGWVNFSTSPVWFTQSCTLKAQNHLLSDVILCLRNNITIIYFDRYLSCFGINIQIILVNLYKLKIEY